jgi:hypothetical protein
VHNLCLSVSTWATVKGPGRKNLRC